MKSMVSLHRGAAAAILAALAVCSVQRIGAQNFVVTTIAGGGWDVGDGKPAKSARLYVPWSLAFDSQGNLYVSESGQHRIRKISPDGLITTIAGTGLRETSADGGLAKQAQISDPSGIVVDKAGNLYFAEWAASKVRKISPAGILSTVAGTGTAGSGGDGGPAVLAQLNGPVDLVFDAAGNLYVSDRDAHRVRKIAPDGKISTFAGNGQNQTKGDGGPADQASISGPGGLAMDTAGNLYIAESYAGRVRKVSTSGVISTFAGGGISSPADGARATSVALETPLGLAFNAAGDLFISDADRPRLFKVTPAGTIGTVAGASGFGYSPDGVSAVQSRIAWPCGLAIDAAGLLYFSDSDANVVRRITAAGNLETVAGNRDFGDGKPAVEAEIGEPGVPVGDGSGGVYIPSKDQNEIWKTGAAGGIAAWLGNGVEMRSQNVSTLVWQPRYAALAKTGTLYVASSDTVLQVTPAGSATEMNQFGFSITCDPGTGRCTMSTQMAGNITVSPSGTLYVAQQGPFRISKVQGSNLVAVAGTGSSGYGGDGGQATAAKVGVVEQMVFDAAGNLYFADTDNHRIRKVDTAGIITTVAGNGTRGFSGDGGQATAAALNWPYGVAIDPAGNLYIADTVNNRIRLVSPTGVIRSIAGTGVAGFSGDGKPAVEAMFHHPDYLWWDAVANELLISDTLNRRIRKLSPVTVPVCAYTVDPTSITATDVETTKTMNVTTTDAACAWTATSALSWAIIQSGASGTGNGIVTLKIAANTGTVERSGKVAVAGKDVAVTQSGAPANRPVIGANGVVNAASFTTTLAPGMFATVFASNLPARQTTWGDHIVDGRLPKELDGVSLKIGGKDCYLSFVGAGQVNALLPPDVPLGEQAVELTTRDGVATALVTVARYSPGFFTFVLDGRLLPVAQFANTTSLVVPEQTPGIAGHPAEAGNYLQFYATGLGPTAEQYPVGMVLDRPYAVEDLSAVQVKIGGLEAEVAYAGVILPGLYQLNIKAPGGVGSGYLPVVATIGGISTQLTAVLPFK